MRGVALALIILFASSIAHAGNAKTVRAAVERAMPFLEEEGKWWIEDKECVSCHHTTFLIWAKDLARDAGVLVNADTLAEQRRWVWESFLQPYEPDSENEDDVAKPGERNGDRNVEGISQLLTSASAKHIPVDTQKTLREIIASHRQNDGTWKPGGQLPMQQRPKPETIQVSTQWARHALREKGSAPVPLTSPAVSTEWYALELINRGDASSLGALLKRQNKDGGWSWKVGEPSSPTATGQALFAMARAEAVNEHSDVAQHAVAYLLTTQSADGHWKTYSTKKRTKTGRISNFWGTAWAVIGLLEMQRVEE